VDPEGWAGNHSVGGQGGKGVIDQGVPGGDVGGSVIAWRDSRPDGSEEEPKESSPSLSPADVLAVAGDGGIALKGPAGGCSKKVSAAASEVEDYFRVTGKVEH
jgi:hypothetical protein